MLPRFLPKRLDSPAGEILLREVQRKDLKALNKTINEPEVNRFVIVHAPVSMKSTEVHYKDNKRNGNVWIACIFKNRVVGSILLMPKIGRVAHVCEFGIAFSKEAHGKGIALAALQYCFTWLKRNGVEKIVSEVFAENKRARAFYKKIGFEEVCVLRKQVKNGKRYGDAMIIEKFF